MNMFMEMQLHEQETRREYERSARDPVLRLVLAVDLAVRRLFRRLLSRAAAVGFHPQSR